MGSGKTAVGSALSRLLSVPFLDSDNEIVQAANMTIPEIFERDGESFFRAKESQVIARLLETERGILSTGGGAFMSVDNRDIISRLGVAVWLRADIDLLWSRVRYKTTRPLLRTDDPFQTLQDIAKEREPIYALADLVVDADPAYSIEDMANEVIGVLQRRQDVLEVK